MAGRVQMMIDPISSSIEYIKAGKLRALAVASLTPSDAVPGLPTVGEFVPGFEMTAWYGVCAPKKTPSGIVNRLNEEINAGLGTAAMKKRIAGLGAMSLVGLPAEFGKRIAEDTRKWGNVIRTAHITAT
jgi:tripartite-type tricarboxylate transporter receptor subunit TctC